MTSAKLIRIPIFEPELNKSYRIGIAYQNNFLPLFWLKVGNDGSVYVGSSQKEKNFFATGLAPVVSGIVSIKYAEAISLHNLEAYRNPSKTSFHASHIINTMDSQGMRHEKPPHRELKGQMLLSMFLFRHPDNMRRRHSKVRNTDVVIDYPFDETKPLHAYLYAEGLSSEIQPIFVESATEQINLMFNYRNMEECGDFRLQIIFAHGPAGVWPPYTYKMFPIISTQ